jgi:hypothetical protein
MPMLHDSTGRFERMIIALSTHALFANTSEVLNAIASDSSAAIVRASKTSYFGFLLT